MRALDVRRLEVRLEHPAPYLVEMLTHTSMMPLPRHAIEAKGKSWTQPGNFVCNGAFVLTEWVPNDHITALKNPRFHDADNVKLSASSIIPPTITARLMNAGGRTGRTGPPAQRADRLDPQRCPSC